MMNKKLCFKNFTALILVTAFMFCGPSLRALKCEVNNPDISKNTVFVDFNFENKEELTQNFNEKSFIEFKFDDRKMKFQSCICKGALIRKNIKIERSTDNIEAHFEADKKFQERTGETSIRFKFKTKRNLYAMKLPLKARFVNIEGNVSKEVISEEIGLENHPEVAFCKLSSLKPNVGEISPAFNPEITEYSMNVSHDVKSIHFDASPLKSGLNVKVSRRNLCAAGQPTDIKIKVSNPAVKGLNKEYIVHVNRGASPAKAKKEKTKKAKKQKSSRKKSDSKDDWFDSLDSCEDNSEDEPAEESSSEESENEEEAENSEQNDEENENSSESKAKTEEPKENIPGNNNLKTLAIITFCALATASTTAAYFIIKKRKSSKK